MSPDQINASFEFLAASFTLLNVRQLLKDKLVRGVHPLPVLFFTAWGVWNLFYYPHLGQWWSFAGGLAMVGMNAWQITLMIYFKTKEWER